MRVIAPRLLSAHAIASQFAGISYLPRGCPVVPFLRGAYSGSRLSTRNDGNSHARQPARAALAARIRDARERAGLTQQELAEEMGPGHYPSKISVWESGREIPREDHWATLMQLLEIPTREGIEVYWRAVLERAEAIRDEATRRRDEARRRRSPPRPR